MNTVPAGNIRTATKCTRAINMSVYHTKRHQKLNTLSLGHSHNQKLIPLRENSFSASRTYGTTERLELCKKTEDNPRASFQRCACAVIETVACSARLLLSLSHVNVQVQLFYFCPRLTLCLRVKIVESASKQHVCVSLRNRRCIYDIFCLVINVFPVFS